MTRLTLAAAWSRKRRLAGTVLAVELQDTEHTARSTLLVRVVRATQQAEDAWVLGCAFTRKLSEAELLALM